MAQAAWADEAAPIYDPSTVVFIDLTLSSEAESKLEAEPGEYVKGTFSLTKSSDGTPAGEESSPVAPPRAVEVRLKGNVGGSFRPLTGKAGFKLKFKKTDAFLGLRKMTLNNMVQDPSMVHETLAYAAFRAAGVPASRTGYAYVRVNGEDFGVYLDLENLDSVGLARIFGSFDAETQHLYEGEGGHDVTPGDATGFEVDEGKEDDLADLEALIEVVNGEGDEPWSERVAADADLAEMTRMWAVEKYIDHWDGYSGHAEAGLRPNNYYLYSEPSGRFQMLPWGADQTWIPTIGVGTPGREVTFDGHGGVLFDKCLEDSDCFRAYWEALQGVKSTIGSLDPASLAQDTADLLAPWQQEERDHGRAEYSAGDSEDGVEETLAYIAARPGEASKWLDDNAPPVEPPEEPEGEPEPEPEGEPEPKPEGEGGESEEPEGGGESRAGVTPPTLLAPAAPKPLPATMRIDDFAVVDGVLSTDLTVTGPGEISQWAKMRVAKKTVGVCSTSETAGNAESLTLRCRLSSTARRRLQARRLRVTVNTAFAPTGGSPEIVAHVVTARRDRSRRAVSAPTERRRPAPR